MIREFKIALPLLAIVPLAAAAEPQPKACRVLEALVGPASCLLTECRRVGHSKVHLGPEKEGVERLQAEGELTLLDHSCGRETPVAVLLSQQAAQLEKSGFTVRAGGGEDSEIVLQKNEHWIELSGVVLEGSPVISVRSVDATRYARPVVAQAVSTPTLMPAATPAPEPVAATPGWGAASPRSEAEPPAASITRTARASGPSPLLPAGMESLSGPAARIEVEVLIDEKAQLQKVLAAKGAPQLIGAAMQSLRDWKFEPALEDGAPKPAVLTLTLDFKAKR